MIKNLLVIRFSAMGDVAMTVPVISSLATQYPEMKITVLTRDRQAPLYSWMPENVCVKGVNLNDYKGLGGLSKLYKELKSAGFDAVADIHDVLRSQYLRFRFKLSGVRVAKINKGRRDKRALIGNSLGSDQLKDMAQRYKEVFVKLGLDFQFDYSAPQLPKEDNIPHPSIGIAPFAAYEGKIYPLDKMKAVIDILVEKGCHIYLFGAGDKEKEVLDSWEGNNVTSTCGKFGGLKNEMELISQLDLMITMDSANMHIAAIMGTPTLSIWGATHPKAGFLAWGQTGSDVIEAILPCRPCSIYGNKPCKYGDYRCMNLITPETIVSKIISRLHLW